MTDTLSASYNVSLAKKYGLEAAALYNKILYLSSYTAREDGYCWRTAEELEDELGISKYQQSRAIKILEEAGLIETKVTYIQGTLCRCKHYRVTYKESKETSLSESKEALRSESKETSLSESKEALRSESKETSLSYESKETSLSESKETSLSIGNNQNNNNLNNQNSNNIYAKPKKHRYGEYKHVLLTDDEYSRLCSEFTKQTADNYIRKVDEYCEMKGASYKNYNLAIRNFIRRDNVKPSYTAPTADAYDLSKW